MRPSGNSKPEIQAATNHSEIVPRSVDHPEAQIVGPTDMPRKSDFETGTKLSEHFRFAPGMRGFGVHSERIGWPLRVNGIALAAAKNRSYASPRIRRIARARNRIS